MIPLSAYLGAVGMPGVTAWMGLTQIIQPKPGETVVVSAASGAVGSAVGQLAKARGCRAVGIAGGADKCAYVVETTGLRRLHRLQGAPRFRRPGRGPGRGRARSGVDGNFENVGGMILDVVMTRMNAFGRIALCGMISGYDGAADPDGATRR